MPRGVFVAGQGRRVVLGLIPGLCAGNCDCHPSRPSGFLQSGVDISADLRLKLAAHHTEIVSVFQALFIIPVKQPQALAVLEDLVTKELGVLTSQILAEFYVNATQKLDPPLTIKEAYERIHNYLLAWQVLDVTGPVVLEAVRGVSVHKMAYWDAQIWATAKLYQIPIIFSEDFNVGGAIEGVRFVNPLVEGFSMLRWLSDLI